MVKVLLKSSPAESPIVLITINTEGADKVAIDKACCCGDICQISFVPTGSGSGGISTELETGIVFLGETATDDSAGSSPYITGGGAEGASYTVLVGQAQADGKWATSIDIGLLADWDDTKTPDGAKASVNVTYRKRYKSINISPGANTTDRASTRVATVIIFSDGSVDLT